MLNQFSARYNASGVVHQIGEQSVFVTGEFDRVAADRYAASACVEAYRPAIELALGMAGGSAEERADTGEHFFEMKRFSDVIISAGIEALHFVAPAIASRQHEHRHGASSAAPSFKDRNAVHFRQADIENDGIVGFGLSEIVALFAIERT